MRPNYSTLDLVLAETARGPNTIVSVLLSLRFKKFRDIHALIADSQELKALKTWL